MATSPPVPFVPNTNIGTNAATRNPANSAKDDNTVQSQVARAVRDSNIERIIPQDNILSQYASYTYNISIYIMSPEDYNQIIRTKKFNIPGSQLLISSGGAPNTSPDSPAPSGGNAGVTGVPAQTQANASAGRNQFFPLDFYINDVKLTSLQTGKGTRSAHSNTTITFKVIEPNGITFIDNLHAAAQAYVGKQQNYAAQHYLMVIKFYGYDETGKMVQAQGLGTDTGGTAVVERWIPFQFTGIKFRIANRLTEYECSAICVPNNIATGQARGIIPYNLEVNAPTLRDVLSGDAGYKTETPAAGPKAPPKATTAPRTTIISGLVQALNQYQEKLIGANADAVGEAPFTVADVYDIVFTDPAIENASLLPPGGVSQSQTPTVQPSNSNQQVNGATQTGSPNAKTVSATAGTSIVQFLDQTIRNSSYIYDQQLKIITVDGEEVLQKQDTGQGVKWYRIGLKTEPIKYDPKRRDYAYKITYIVSPYIVNEVKGPYFPSTKFKGTHKKYLYWYTGLNNEVLSYEQDFNYLYYIVINSGQELPSTTLDFREEAKRAYQTTSNESSQGLAGKTNDAGANAADQLYSPADLSRAKLSILGDPAWIRQNELWFGTTDLTDVQAPFFPDGSINTEIEEPLFEVGFNKPADYNLQSGRMEVNSKYLGANRYVTGESGNGLASQSYIYRAVSVVSTFSNGRFTQDLEGVLVTFDRSAIRVNATDVDGQYVETPQETERLLANVDRSNAARGASNTLTRSTAAPGQATSPTTPPARQNPAAPAPTAPARAPTSSGQTIGAAAPPGNTNPQTGGTTTSSSSSVTAQFSEATFLQRNPTAYREFVAFRSAKEKEIYAAQVAKLTAQASSNNNGTVSTRQRELIEQQALDTARRQSNIDAIQKFAPQIQAAGAGTVNSTTSPAAQQGAAVPRAPQVGSREP